MLTVNQQPKRNKSCDYCRRSHSKCDGNQPCANCSMRNLVCVYSTTKQRSKRKLSKSQTKNQPDDQIIKLQNQVQQLQQSFQYWQNKYTQLKLHLNPPLSVPTTTESEVQKKKRKIQTDDTRLQVSAVLHTHLQRIAFSKHMLPENVRFCFSSLILSISLYLKYQI